MHELIKFERQFIWIHLADAVIYIVLICRRRWQLKQTLWQDIVVGPGAHRYPWSALLIQCKSEHETSSRSASGAPFRPFQVLKKHFRNDAGPETSPARPGHLQTFLKISPQTNVLALCGPCFDNLFQHSKSFNSVALLWQSKVISIYTMSFMC